VRQVSPDIEDLTGRESHVDQRTRQYPLGAWGAEARDYHLSVTVPANDVGVEMLAARVSLVTDDEVVGPGLVRAIWTEDEIASARVNREVAHYTGQAALAEDIQLGLAALKDGDERTATFRLGRATRTAVESGHEGTVQLLRKVVEVEDVRSGTVRLRPRVAKSDEMALDTRSTRTVRVERSGPAGPSGPAAPVPAAPPGPPPARSAPPAHMAPAAAPDDDMVLDTRSTRTVRVGGRRTDRPTAGPAPEGGTPS
jgi:hypothetical protein